MTNDHGWSVHDSTYPHLNRLAKHLSVRMQKSLYQTKELIAVSVWFAEVKNSLIITFSFNIQYDTPQKVYE